MISKLVIDYAFKSAIFGLLYSILLLAFHHSDRYVDYCVFRPLHPHAMAMGLLPGGAIESFYNMAGGITSNLSQVRRLWTSISCGSRRAAKMAATNNIR